MSTNVCELGGFSVRCALAQLTASHLRSGMGDLMEDCAVANLRRFCFKWTVVYFRHPAAYLLQNVGYTCTVRCRYVVKRCTRWQQKTFYKGFPHIAFWNRAQRTGCRFCLIVPVLCTPRVRMPMEAHDWLSPLRERPVIANYPIPLKSIAVSSRRLAQHHVVPTKTQ